MSGVVVLIAMSIASAHAMQSWSTADTITTAAQADRVSECIHKKYAEGTMLACDWYAPMCIEVHATQMDCGSCQIAKGHECTSTPALYKAMSLQLNTARLELEPLTI